MQRRLSYQQASPEALKAMLRGEQQVHKPAWRNRFSDW